MNIDAEIRFAYVTTQAVIDLAYERARRRLLDAANEGRRDAGLMPFVIVTSDRRSIKTPPRYRCPECGGRLFAEMECWEATTGKPEEALLCCENEDWGVDDDGHMHLWSDWDGVSDAVLRWARGNVRIL